MKSDTLTLRRAPAPPGAPYRDMLIPADEKTAALIADLPLGSTVTLKLKRDRSTPQQRLYWAILQHISESSQWETAERLHVALKIRLGYFDLMQLPSGKAVPIPHSTAFDKMTHDEFTDYFDKAIRLICQEVVPGMDSARLIAEVQAMIGGVSPDSLREVAA